MISTMGDPEGKAKGKGGREKEEKMDRERERSEIRERGVIKHNTCNYNNNNRWICSP